jgi:hypothetical protein
VLHLRSVNLRGQSGIYKTIKLIDAFLIKDANLSVVLLYNDETENNLLKIYISKYEDNKILPIDEEEWSKIKIAMANIISSKEKYECINLPNVLEQRGQLKPCLIKTYKHFECHYENKDVNKVAEEKKPEAEDKYDFSSKSQEVEDVKEEVKEDSISFLAKKAKDELDAEKNINEFENSKIDGKDYKEQKDNLIKVISRSVDDMLEIKNKEIVRLNDTIDSLENDLQRSELEKKQALNVINLYHEKIKKLNDAIKSQKEE